MHDDVVTGVVTGNASVEGEVYRGWFVGHFVAQANDPRFTSALEVKWATYEAGAARSRWAKNVEATTLSILIQGRFRLQFHDREVVLCNPGDYALWLPGVPHIWSAEAASTILTVRYPSKAGDSIELD